MAISRSHKLNWKIAFLIPLLIFAACYAITFTPQFRHNTNILSTAILIDLLITAPLAWFIVIRKSSVSRWTVLRVFVLGLFVSSLILRSVSNPVLPFLKTYISPLLEILVIGFIARKFYVASGVAKKNQGVRVDFLMQSRSVMTQVLGNEKLANVLSSEIAVCYYAFFSGRDRYVDYKTRFSIYRENGLMVVLGAILFLFLIETVGMHFLIAIWSNTTAWVFTALSLYTCLQLFAHMRAVKSRSITIGQDGLHVCNGLAGDAWIQTDNIQSIEVSRKIPKSRQAVKVSLLKGLENHNIIIHLKEPILVTKIFGIKRKTDTILFFVDRSKDFLDAVNAHLICNSCYSS